MIGLTYSRGGVLVAVVVVALWMVLSKAWIEALSTLLAAGLPAAGALAVAFSLAGLTSDGQPHATRVRAGIVFGVVLIADALIAAGLARFQLPGTSLVRRLSLRARWPSLAAAALVVGATHAQSWWRSFTAPSASDVTQSPGRLVEVSSNFRWAWWTQAWQGWQTKPIVGTGAGSFPFTNLRYRKTSLDQTIEPHSLPVQFLSETGVIGLLLFLGSIGWLVVRGRRRPGPQLALALALPAYFLHGLLDIDWDFLSVSGPVFLIAGALAVRPSTRPRPRPFTAAHRERTPGDRSPSRCSRSGSADTGRARPRPRSARTTRRRSRSRKRARTVDPLAVDPLFTAANAESNIAARILKARRPAGGSTTDRRSRPPSGT